MVLNVCLPGDGVFPLPGAGPTPKPGRWQIRAHCAVRVPAQARTAAPHYQRPPVHHRSHHDVIPVKLRHVHTRAPNAKELGQILVGKGE